MVMKAMLIGLLVIGAVAMLETDVSAACVPCFGNKCCCWLPTDLNMLLEEVKKHGSKQLLLIGHTQDDPSISQTLKWRDELIQRGLQPETIGELILEGRTPRMPTRKGQMVIVDQPK
jgi:hypothetical protein